MCTKMSEEEVEKFEITDFDLENEFSGFKFRKGLTKHQQIYGKLDNRNQFYAVIARDAKKYPKPCRHLGG